jgi:hypothetical protein
LTPLAAGSFAKYDGTSATSVDAPAGDWSTTGTQTLYTQYDVSDLPTDLQCVAGGIPSVTGIGVLDAVTSASPDAQDSNSAFSSYSPGENSIYAKAPGGAGGGWQSDIHDYQGIIYPLLSPASITAFNSGGLKIYTGHYRDGNTQYSVTTKIPKVRVELSCQIEPDPTPADTAKAAANSPKTGATEVIAFVTGSSLIFVGYEATRMFRKNKTKKATSAK